MTSSPYKWLGKVQRKAEAKINQCQKIDTKRKQAEADSLEQRCQQFHLTKHAMIQQILAQLKTNRKQIEYDHW